MYPGVGSTSYSLVQYFYWCLAIRLVETARSVKPGMGRSAEPDTARSVKICHPNHTRQHVSDDYRPKESVFEDTAP